MVGVDVCFVFLTMEPSLSCNLLQYTPSWPQTQRSASLSEIKSMCQHTQLACIYVKYTADVPGALRVQRRTMDPKEPELWEPNPGLLENQQVLLTTELSL